MNLDCDEKTLSKIVLIFFHFLFLMCTHSRSQWGALKWPCLHEAPSPHAGCQFGLLFSPPSHSSILPSLTYAHSRTRKWPHECEVLVDMPAVMSQTWPTPSLFRLSRLDIQSSQRGTLKQPRLRTMQRKDADIDSSECNTIALDGRWREGKHPSSWCQRGDSCGTPSAPLDIVLPVPQTNMKKWNGGRTP